MEIVNIVASGKLETELDLGALYEDINVDDVRYEPERFPALQIRFTQEGPVVMLFSSGSYTIVGVDAEDHIKDFYQKIVSILEELEISFDIEDSRPKIQNLICKGELCHEIDLNTLIIALGLENIEYEPEQSPFVYYWPEGSNCLITIPTNGQCIVTGVRTLEQAENIFSSFQEEINHIFSSGEY